MEGRSRPAVAWRSHWAGENVRSFDTLCWYSYLVEEGGKGGKEGVEERRGREQGRKKEWRKEERKEGRKQGGRGGREGR